MVTEIRRKLRDSLMARIGHHRFDLWFSEPFAFRVDGGTLYVGAKDAFSLGRIRTQFDADLRHVAQEFGSLISDLVYAVVPSGNSAPAASEADRNAIRAKNAAKPAQHEDSPKKSVSAESSADSDRLHEFADFEFGESNSLVAHSMQLVSADPGQISPLFLYGDVGCGKTELLLRCVRSCRRVSKRRRGIYVTAEQFTSHFVDALKGRGLPGFRHKYRDLDVLAVDDVQFFDNKRATIVEFQNTIDQLQRTGKQIMLSADRPPDQLTFLGKELVNRVAAGLVCRVHYPCEAARTTILQRQCARRGITVTASHLSSIAQRLNGDVRQLSGAVNRLHAAYLSKMDLASWTTVYALLKDLFQAGRTPVSMETIERAVSDVCGVASVELRSNKRSKRINVARDLAMWLARKHIGSAFSEIGSHYGGRSHSTVISSQQKVHRWLQSGEVLSLPNQDNCSAGDVIQQIECKLRIG